MAAQTASLPHRRSPFPRRPRHGIASRLFDHRLTRGLLGLFGLSLLGAGFAAWQNLHPASMAPGWQYRVRLDDIERVAALLPDGQGGFYLSQELPDGQGRILRIGPDARGQLVASGLSKPDGMVRYRGGLAFSQEQGEQPVSWMNAQGSRQLFSANAAEGLATDNHYLYAVEDLPGEGRLLRYDPETDSVTTLRGGLDEAEGLAHCPDGRLFYTEKVRGHVRQLVADGSDPVIRAGLREPGFLLCNHDGLWITEDATHKARVLLLDSDGRLTVVLSHLRAPQAIVETTPGHYLVAEQGRDRVLELHRLRPDP